MKKEEEHYTGDDEKKGCWCNPKMTYIEESDSWVIIYNTLLERDDLESSKIN